MSDGSAARSEGSPLHQAIKQKFAAAFGPPHNTLGKDSHWSLRSLRYIAAVNVLVNGSPELPVVWIFDPHDPRDGVSHIQIKSDTDIEAIIRAIEDRVKNAGRGGSMRVE
jgi:hypothetical protein